MSTLFVNACVRDGSRTEELAGFFLDRWKDEVREVNLQRENIQPLNGLTLTLRDRLVEERMEDHPLTRYAWDFARADTVVIAAPYWDLSFPSSLKVYLEAVSVCGVTFRYENGVPKGLCRAERLFYVTTSGGPVVRDFGYSYVRELAVSFYGIRRTERFCAEGLDMSGADVEGILAGAKGEIERWFERNRKEKGGAVV